MAHLEQVYCLIRKTWVAATPEEIVRQRLVSHMVHNLQYPPGLLALEKEIRQHPHLQLNDQEIPDRRADLICYGKDIHPDHALFPLLLIECKAVRITNRVLNQVIGYNHFLKAHFISVVNGEEIRTGWFDPVLQDYRFVKSLPSYPELLESIKK